MEKLKAILAGLLTTVYKMSDEQVAALVAKADGEDFNAEETLAELVNADKTRISKISTEKFNQGEQKGRSNSLSTLEEQVRGEYGISDDSLKGLDLIKAVHALDREKSKNGVTDDDIKKSKLFIELQKKLDDTNKEIEIKINTAVETEKSKYTRERTLEKAKSAALRVLTDLKPVLSTDEKRAKKQQDLFLKEIEPFEFDESEDGSLIVKKDGKAYDDGHGNLITFDELIKDTASSIFDFQQSSPRDTPGNKTDSKKGAVTPKTEDEYNKYMLDKNIPVEERIAIKEAWNKGKA